MPKIHYECQRCGNCCRWPGAVRVTEAEVDRIAAFLKIPLREFIEASVALMPDRSGLTLRSRPDGSCAFLEGVNTCAIQPVKPLQCAGFPNAWNFPGWREVCEARETVLP